MQLHGARGEALLVREQLLKHQQKSNGVLFSSDVDRTIIFANSPEAVDHLLWTRLLGEAAIDSARLADELPRTVMFIAPADVVAEESIDALVPSPVSHRAVPGADATTTRWFVVFASVDDAAAALRSETILINGAHYELREARESVREAQRGERIRADEVDTAREAAEYQQELRHRTAFAMDPVMRDQILQLGRPAAPSPASAANQLSPASHRRRASPPPTSQSRHRPSTSPSRRRRPDQRRARAHSPSR